MSNRPDAVRGVQPTYVEIDSSGTGRGVAAARWIAAGETVLAFRGPLLNRGQVEDFTHVIEIGPGRFLGPSGEPDDLVNHSCDPNCAVRVEGDRAVLWALRTILRHEELTYDYSTTMVTDPTAFPCSCGAANCRGRVRRWAKLPVGVRKLQSRRGMVPRFVSAAAG